MEATSKPTFKHSSRWQSMPSVSLCTLIPTLAVLFANVITLADADTINTFNREVIPT